MKNKIVVFFLLAVFPVFGQADLARVTQHLSLLTKMPGFRNYQNVGRLDQTAHYIHDIFAQYADSVSYQPYVVEGRTYKNVIASFGTENKKRIIIGAHYDACGDQEGADDNASGVTALLELSRLLQGKKLSCRIDLVAYTLEEPPYFDTEQMGSYIHAQSLKKEKADVYGMISVEMIGYFSEEKHSQDYPVGILSLFYGNKGDYITLVKKFGAKSFVRKFIRKYKSAHTIKAKKFSAPLAVEGITLSDHFNYWNAGFDAMMITDTSFYRNKNYHEASDKMETLDIPRMVKVIDGIYKALVEM